MTVKEPPHSQNQVHSYISAVWRKERILIIFKLKKYPKNFTSNKTVETLRKH